MPGTCVAGDRLRDNSRMRLITAQSGASGAEHSLETGVVEFFDDGPK